MSKSTLDIAGLGQVFLTRKRGQRTIRLRVDNNGAIQVSMPWLVPNSTALDFIRTKQEWIKEQQDHFLFRPYDGMLIGKTLRLKIHENSKTTRTKAEAGKINVHFQGDYSPENIEHTERIKKAIIKELRVEAEKFLLPRLQEIADLYGFSYKSASVKQVIGRWGSCDTKKHISLSLYLVQLPIEMIDYVLIHELAHTVHMNHSKDFWGVVARHCPEYKSLRKQIRGMRPKIYDVKAFMA